MDNKTFIHWLADHPRAHANCRAGDMILKYLRKHRHSAKRSIVSLEESERDGKPVILMETRYSVYTIYGGNNGSDNL